MSLCGLFIEPRKLSQVPLTIENFFNTIANAPLYFYCGEGLGDYYSGLTTVYPKLIIRELDVSNLDGNTYSDFLKQAFVWESLSGDYVLTVQTDGCICDKSPFTIDDFMKYDYVGGYSHVKEWWKEIKGLHEYNAYQCFNGGFSLRKRQCMIDAINTYPPQKSCQFQKENPFETYWEDLYFTVCLLKMNKKVGLDEYATKFCSRSTYTSPTFCIHNLHFHASKLILEECIKYCPLYEFFLKPTPVWFSDEERITYYTNHLETKYTLDTTIYKTLSETEMFPPNRFYAVTNEKLHILNSDISQQELYKTSGRYFTLFSMFYMMGIYPNHPFLFYWGDTGRILCKMPYICKARNCDDTMGCILKLNMYRHWGLISKVKENDILFSKKRDEAIWRGSTTGMTSGSHPRDFVNNRLALVRISDKEPLIDADFTNITNPYKDSGFRIARKLNIREQLSYKFIISAEGNDVASGLKWQLYSNSVVIMKKPTVVSWAMEDKLIPFVHYIPVKDDYSDLVEKINWGLENKDKCIEISKNATEFIEQFLDPEREERLQTEVFKRVMEYTK